MSESMEKFFERLASLPVPWHIRQGRYVRTIEDNLRIWSICPIVAVGLSIDPQFPAAAFIERSEHVLGLDSEEVLNIMGAADYDWCLPDCHVLPYYPERAELRQRILRATRLDLLSTTVA